MVKGVRSGFYCFSKNVIDFKAWRYRYDVYNESKWDLFFSSVKPPRGKPRGIPIRMAELSVAFSPPSLKLRRALLAIHPHGKPWGLLAKETKFDKR